MAQTTKVETLKLPVIKAYENGELEIIQGQENGWKVAYPPADVPRMVTVFHHRAAEAELVVTCSRLEYGESIYIILVPCCAGMLHDEVYIADHVNDDDNESCEIEDVLAYSVNQGFHNIEQAYNHDPIYSVVNR